MFEDLNSHMSWSVPPIIGNDLSFIDHLLNMKSCFSISKIEIFAITWWFMWYNRNSMIFCQEYYSPAKVSSMIRAYAHKIRIHGATIDDIDTHFSLHATQKGGVSSGKCKIRDQVSWCPLPINYYKVNFGGSKLPNSQVSFGFVIRDLEGKVFFMWCRCFRFVGFYSCC